MALPTDWMVRDEHGRIWPPGFVPTPLNARSGAKPQKAPAAAPALAQAAPETPAPAPAAPRMPGERARDFRFRRAPDGGQGIAERVYGWVHDNAADEMVTAAALAEILCVTEKAIVDAIRTSVTAGVLRVTTDRRITRIGLGLTKPLPSDTTTAQE